MDASIQAGVYQMRTSSNPSRNIGVPFKQNNGNFISPNFAIYLKGIDRISYSFTIGYTFTQTSFTPGTVSLDDFQDFNLPDYVGPVQHFNVGFGVLVNVGKLNIKQD